MNKSLTTKLETEFDIIIGNFIYFSGNCYKSSFDMLATVNGTNKTINVVVRCSETYRDAIKRALFRARHL